MAGRGIKDKSIRPEVHGMSDKAAFQVIVLGNTGGPREDSVTGLLVRSTSTEWSKGSVVAVDAGTLLAGIIRTLEHYTPGSKDGRGLMKKGPFIGLNLPNMTAQANAAYIFREIIGAVLITHPHLDHLAGLAINTPLVEAGSGPKTVAALPSVISAIKNHMFNDVIWPNLSDEDGGAGLVTYQRLVEGGNPRFGLGDAKGYVRACEGLLTKCVSVSHGRCRQRYHPESGRHHHVGSAVFSPESLMLPSRTISVDHGDASIFAPVRSPRISVTGAKESSWATVESSAFFVRDAATGSEMIVFGDIEPDSVSLEPRNKRVWEIAAPKVASGSLRAIFIECSFNNAIDDNSLYGHLCPRHLIAELKVLAAKVADAQQPSSSRGRSKRKRNDSDSAGETAGQVSPRSLRPLPHIPGKSRRADDSPSRASTARSGTRSRLGSGDNNAEPPELVHDEHTPSFPEPVDLGDDGPGADDPNVPENIKWADSTRQPLAGLSIYIIHIKDTLADGPPPGHQILRELRTEGDAAGLGCEFFVPKCGEGIWI
ncbi:cAMP phosphodiesterases class-II domain containing protein [Elaphomyces granulatus]